MSPLLPDNVITRIWMKKLRGLDKKAHIFELSYVTRLTPWRSQLVIKGLHLTKESKNQGLRQQRANEGGLTLGGTG